MIGSELQTWRNEVEYETQREKYRDWSMIWSHRRFLYFGLESSIVRHENEFQITGMQKLIAKLLKWLSEDIKTNLTEGTSDKSLQKKSAMLAIEPSSKNPQSACKAQNVRKETCAKSIITWFGLKKKCLDVKKKKKPAVRYLFTKKVKYHVTVITFTLPYFL